MAVDWPLTLYVDAACPLCATEIAILAGRDTARRLRFADCALHPDDTTLRTAGLTRAGLRCVLHARDAGGRWLRGIDVLAAAYGAAGLRWQAALLRGRHTRRFFAAWYRWIAPRRALLARLGGTFLVRVALGGSARQALAPPRHCDDGGCGR